MHIKYENHVIFIVYANIHSGKRMRLVFPNGGPQPASSVCLKAASEEQNAQNSIANA